MEKYIPIACSLHDQLEDAIVKRIEGEIVYTADDGANITIYDRLVDWVNESNVEYAITSTGIKIRLDRILSLFDIPFRGQTC